MSGQIVRKIPFAELRQSVVRLPGTQSFGGVVDATSSRRTRSRVTDESSASQMVRLFFFASAEVNTKHQVVHLGAKNGDAHRHTGTPAACTHRAHTGDASTRGSRNARLRRNCFCFRPTLAVERGEGHERGYTTRLFLRILTRSTSLRRAASLPCTRFHTHASAGRVAISVAHTRVPG